MSNGWARGERIAAISLAVAILAFFAAAMVVPEVRHLFGRQPESRQEQPRNEVATLPTSSSAPVKPPTEPTPTLTATATTASSTEQNDDITLGPLEAVEWVGGKDVHLHVAPGPQERAGFWVDKYYDDGTPAHLQCNFWEPESHHIVKMVLWNPSGRETAHAHRTWSGGLTSTRYLRRGSRVEDPGGISGSTRITLPAGRSMAWDLMNLAGYGWHPDVWFDSHGNRMEPRFNTYCYRKGETEPMYPDDASKHPVEHELAKMRFVSRSTSDVEVEISYVLKSDRTEANLSLPVLEPARH